jgi:hypothetical protein
MYADWLEQSVNDFGYIDRKYLIERYKPGYKKTISEMLIDLQSSRKKIRYERIISHISEYNISKDNIAFQINNYAFKGPDVTLKPSPSVTRIMNIGDSCTFGTYIDSLCYPRELERILNDSQLGKFEVINAGHLGINFNQVLAVLDEWLLLEPHIITIYLGWNRTILRADPRKNDYLYKNFALYKFYYHSFVNRSHLDSADDLYTGEYNLNDPILKKLQHKTFKYDLIVLEKIIKKISEKSPDIKVAIVTLAGLYSRNIIPSRGDLKKGYALAFTNNLAAWGILSEQYNRILRKFARQHNIYLFDLETYAIKNFHPRTKFFFDSVHPTPYGHSKIAYFIANSIANNIIGNRKSSSN